VVAGAGANGGLAVIGACPFCTFVFGPGGNGGFARGGGVASANAVIGSSTIVNNSAESGLEGIGTGSPVSGTVGGGGVAVTTGVILQATIVSGSSISPTVSPLPREISGTITSLGFNLVRGGAPGLIASDLTPAAYAIGALADNGGNTWTRALGPGNVAIGAAAGASCPNFDQRGFPRRPGFCDIGAYAVQPDGFTLLGGNNQSQMTLRPFSQTLSVRATFNGVPLPNAMIRFLPPLTGPSAWIGPQAPTPPATTFVQAGLDGVATVTATANSLVGGPYNVVATAAGGPPGAPLNAVPFSLTNTVGPVFVPSGFRERRFD
ncbi:MAG: hypothetical protein NZ518_08760, partial [Dehalococcoidia bacterium]|nr:hypothetical protein [Dehalococcoidia bacterium]